jgi:hypothetical protein
MKPAPVGNVWVANARLYDCDGKLIGQCMDTPNSIAKALMECPKAEIIKGVLGWTDRRDYRDRMKA